MIIENEKNAREYVALWRGQSGARNYLRIAMESQEGLARSLSTRDPRASKGHARAARVLREAIERQEVKS